MKEREIREAVETYINGNRREFKQILHECSKLDLVKIMDEMKQVHTDNTALFYRLLEE